MSYDDEPPLPRKNTCIHGMKESTCGYCGPTQETSVPGSRIADGAQSGIPMPVCIGCKKPMDFGTFNEHMRCAGIKVSPVLQRREAARLARIVVAKKRRYKIPDDLWRVCGNASLDRFAAVEATDQRSFVFYLGTSAWESWGRDLLEAI
jgi:hypothetical protein